MNFLQSREHCDLFFRCVAVLESHFSVVTSLAFSQSGETMIRLGVLYCMGFYTFSWLRELKLDIAQPLWVRGRNPSVILFQEKLSEKKDKSPCNNLETKIIWISGNQWGLISQMIFKSIYQTSYGSSFWWHFFHISLKSSG